METKVFAIYDEAAQAYMQPFFSHTRGLAIRGIVTALKNAENLFSQNPKDFSLYEVGTWNDLSGVISSTHPEHVGRITDYLDASIGEHVPNTPRPHHNPPWVEDNIHEEPTFYGNNS